MKRSRCSLAVLLALLSGVFLFRGQAAANDTPPIVTPGTGLAQGLFQLNEMDMHVHCGLERPVPLNDWIDLAKADGRKVLLTLDHRELYDQSPKEVADWAAENKFPVWYPTGKAGQQALMNDLAGLNKRSDVLAFRGWEIWEGELDEGLDRDAMRLAEVIGWHISASSRLKPCGKSLIERAQQILEVQKEFPVPMIIFHPFPAFISYVQKQAKEKGKDAAGLTAQDYRFFQSGDQEALARLLAGKSLYIEISRGQEKYFENPAIREALIADIKPLADMGVQFTVSTDAHSLKDIQHHFDPKIYCDAIGVAPENTNTLIRELIAIRAKRSLQ